jgi:hypothetical protein
MTGVTRHGSAPTGVTRHGSAPAGVGTRRRCQRSPRPSAATGSAPAGVNRHGSAPTTFLGGIDR